ncbi:hypothetical protein SAMN05192533_11688 [Mesobacillus persicus]|uniref:Uncharacterized protein n=1 Tax=Mesobacillus persicus TaxID=930146 RepID=A0A1H8I8N0_9BACI|nr:hypothetical protein SAMN05192533_11688 [Mesobacillus persicus]
MKQMKKTMCNWRNTENREGAHGFEKPFAWAEVRDFSLASLCYFEGLVMAEGFIDS